MTSKVLYTGHIYFQPPLNRHNSGDIGSTLLSPWQHEDYLQQDPL